MTGADVRFPNDVAELAHLRLVQVVRPRLGLIEACLKGIEGGGS